MKIAILTTDTLHHKYFISQICLTTDEVFCILENKILKPKFDTKIKFEGKREIFEKNAKNLIVSKKSIIDNYITRIEQHIKS